MTMGTLEDLFVDKLKDIHDAERRITRALPKMAKAVSSEELAAAFEEHLAVTEKQIERLDQIFQNLGKPAGRKICHGMKGLLEEGEELMSKDAENSVMDAGLIGAAQEVEHYEISAYGTLKAWADILGNREAAKLLQQSLEEEEEADERLSELASSINPQAAEGDEETEDGEESEEEGEDEDEMVGTSGRRASAGGVGNGPKAKAKSRGRER